MMRFLRQSTAANVIIGPLLAASDGYTPDNASGTAFVYRIRQGETSRDVVHATQGGGLGMPSLDAGYYLLALDATDTAVVGRMRTMMEVTDDLPIFDDWFVLPAGVYDALTTTTLISAGAVLTAAGLAAAPTGSTITVAQTAAVGSITDFNLETSQYASPSLPITCALSQQGDSHKFAIYPLDDFSAPTATIGSTLCTVGASPYTTVTVALDDAYTATAGVFSYILRNVTDDIDAARGTLRIRPASNLTST